MKKTLLSCVILASMLSACANIESQPNVYQSTQLNHAQYTSYATITSLKGIVIQDNQSATNPLLTLGGTVLGGLAGSQVGGGSGRIAGAIVGGLAGGYATNAVVSKAQTQNGVEFTVRMDNGQILTFAQAGQVSKFYVGQRVKLVTNPQSGITKIDSN